MRADGRTEQEIAQETRWKIPSLQKLGYAEMWGELNQIEEEFGEMYEFMELGDNEAVSAAYDDNEDDVQELRTMLFEAQNELESVKGLFSSFTDDADAFVWMMREDEAKELRNNDDDPYYTTCRAYDDCTVALVGNRYNWGVDGFDIFEGDVFGLPGPYDALNAAEVAKKRLMRMKKADMIDLIGSAVSCMMRFTTFYLQYQILSQTFDRIVGVNLDTLNAMKKVDEYYSIVAEEMARCKRYGFGYRILSDKARRAEEELDRLLESMPGRFWVE